MKLPKYWAKGHTRHALNTRHPFTGKPMGTFACWGWSNTSEKEARERGSRRADAVAEMIKLGKQPDHYLYGDRPMREKIFDEWKRGDGSTYAAVTLNSYGCRVLNTANAMFIDVDLAPTSGWEMFKHKLGLLMGKSGPSPLVIKEQEALIKAEAMSQADPHFGMRAYRTRAGLRYLVTHQQADPTADITFRTMVLLGADPLYIRLCKAQACFRARLTPKPWRCGSQVLSIPYPWRDSKAEEAAQSWLKKYTKESKTYASCTFIKHMGSTTMDREIARIVEFHDTCTKAQSDLQLA